MGDDMIQGWNVETKLQVEREFNNHLMEAEAQPVFAEVGEKVREMASQLHEKIIMQEMQWILMLTPLSMVRDLQKMCDNEVTRRIKEQEQLAKESNDGQGRKTKEE
jgi:hypothetical protein